MTKNKFKRARKKLGLSQTEFGIALGFQRNAIAKMERGEPIRKATALAVKYLINESQIPEKK